MLITRRMATWLSHVVLFPHMGDTKESAFRRGGLTSFPFPSVKCFQVFNDARQHFFRSFPRRKKDAQKHIGRSLFNKSSTTTPSTSRISIHTSNATNLSDKWRSEQLIILLFFLGCVGQHEKCVVKVAVVLSVWAVSHPEGITFPFLMFFTLP